MIVAYNWLIVPLIDAFGIVVIQVPLEYLLQVLLIMVGGAKKAPYGAFFILLVVHKIMHLRNVYLMRNSYNLTVAQIISW